MCVYIYNFIYIYIYIKGMFEFVSVYLYHYTIKNDYTWYDIYSTWFLDSRIWTCISTFQSVLSGGTYHISRLVHIIHSTPKLALVLRVNQALNITIFIGILISHNAQTRLMDVVMVAFLCSRLCYSGKPPVVSKTDYF